MALQTAVFETSWGWMAAAACPGPEPGAAALKRVVLPHPTREEAERALAGFLHGTPAEPAGLEEPGWACDLVRELQAYFAGELRRFTLPLDLSEASGFRLQALELALAIPYGQTRTYQELSNQAGSPGGARAVGTAMATNPLPILVPCHRVLGSHGSLTGYLGGPDMKARLLQLEGARLC